MSNSHRAWAEDVRRLRMFHTHTEESIDVVYYRNGTYDAEALGRLNRFLRDFRSEDEHPIDPGVFDILWNLAVAVENPTGTYEVISCYRSPETNAMLRARSTGVAKRSQHLEGKAIDVRLRGTELRTLHEAALSLRAGGVGFYPDSGFVHVDTGRVRRW